MQSKLITDLYTIPEILESGIAEFQIKSYQRGYRWDIENIKTLIDDIIHCSPNSIYCMQPLVVTVIDDVTYEVIDGQQRLTTFKILSYCLQLFENESQNKHYHISYETRSCATFLKKLYSNQFPYHIERLDLASIRNLWDTLNLSPDEKNRDNFHLFQSYCTCCFVLKTLDRVSLNSLINKLKNQVKFIWYEVDLSTLNTTAEKLFANINKNKIRLTGADLIKALFILDIENNDAYNVEVKHHKKQNFANEWDEVEQTLGNPNFWFFITNSNEQYYDVRIGKLFDIITKNRQETDLGSYFLMNENSSLRNWSAVYQSFKIALEWFEDSYLYHRIGFLVNMNILSFETILNEYNKEETRSKKAFNGWLNGHIKTYMNSFGLSELNYNKHKGRFGQCTAVLMLYNILLLEKYYPNQKFSFGDFIEQDWSLEHIQPQKPKVKTAASWIGWLNETENIIADKFVDDYQKVLLVDSDQYNIKEINYNDLLERLGLLNDNATIPKDLILQLDILQDIFEEEFPTHKIQNLALLDKVTNSKLSNGSFKEKRSLILKINEKEQQNASVFLPLGTINVFSKTMITDIESIQLDYWSPKDSEYYLMEISQILKPYLNA